MTGAKLTPSTVYLLLAGVSAFASVLAFTANLVYQVDDAGLSPLQLVLAGTIWEATYFVFEVPTGIVADIYSRRTSVLIGMFISAAGLATIGAFPEFGTILAGYVVLGVGGTFISGAQDAWIADEVGADKAGDIFLRGSQWTRGGTLLAIPLAAGLGSIDIQIPQFAGAAITAALGVFLLLAMRETAFTPVPREDRKGAAAMFRTVAEARGLVRQRPVLITVLAIAAVFGAASEGFDRLFSPHFLRDIGLPSRWDLDPIVWFGLISGVQTVLAIVVVQRVRNRLDTSDHAALARALQAVDVLRIVGVAAFAFSASFATGLVAYWPTRVFVSVHNPLYRAWINLSLESRVRATMLSVSGQCDSFGQVVGGPIVGLAANSVSIRAGLLVAAFMLAPVVLLYRRAIGRGGTAPPATA